jgi:amino acid transporter
MVTDICSARTLFAFCLVCGGVLKLRMDPSAPPSKFKTPYINSKYILPVLFVLIPILLGIYSPDTITYYLDSSDFVTKIPVYIFMIGFAAISYLAFRHNFSLIPALGLVSCFYMLSQLGHRNWLYFCGWLIIGLIIYFVYGYHRSKLATLKQ